MVAATADEADIGAALARVRDVLRKAEAEAGRPAGAVTLVAVSKTHGAARILPALAAGQRVFGENRVQEAAAKWPAIRASHPDVQLHLIGPLQTNKIKDAVALFDVVETVDRPKLARGLAVEMERTGKRPRCLIEVNTGAEPQKGGVLPGDADAFIAACRDDFALPLDGLMCIPPAHEEPSLHFALLREIAQRNGLAQLSMGMSADFEIAVRFGATMVRVGTAIFGERETL